MILYNKVGRISPLVMLGLLSIVWMTLQACCLFQRDTIVLPESQVQKMSKGASANFDGYLLTSGALVKLLEKAEACKK